MRIFMQGKVSRWLLLLLMPLALSNCVFGKSGHGQPADGTPKQDSSGFTFAWMAQSPYRPLFRVLDTESSLGPYARQTKTITLEDLIKMHGHPCDGLVTAACALSVGLERLYPGGIIDRTDTGCVTNNSPCYGDVAAYLTGGRIRFGRDPSLPAAGMGLCTQSASAPTFGSFCGSGSEGF
jgi:hypothetical protein